jgi:hypothetical protein
MRSVSSALFWELIAADTVIACDMITRECTSAYCSQGDNSVELMIEEIENFRESVWI